MLAIPLVFLQSGLIPTIFMVTFFLVVSSLAATCVAQAIASIPDNRQYQQRVEFGTAVQYFYGDRWHIVFQVCMNITVQAYNIASVVICAQSLDQAIATLAGHTYALELRPHFGFHSYHDVDALYSGSFLCITLGYAIITLFFLPAGFLNLNDNVKTVQVGSFVFLVILMIEFVGFFFWRGGQDGYHSVPAFGSTYSQLVSVFIFSWAYIIFIPSWLNEKAVDVSVNKVIWSAGIASWVGYVAIGWLCASAFGLKAIGDDDMLTSLEHADMPTLTRITAYLFSLGVIAPGIPVCSVTTRYNLFVGGVCGKKQSYFWGCIAPWIVGFFFCQGPLFANLLNWTSLVFNGLVNFLVPFAMYCSSLKMVQAGGAPKMSEAQIAAAALLAGDEERPARYGMGAGAAAAAASTAGSLQAQDQAEKDALVRSYAAGLGVNNSGPSSAALRSPLLSGSALDSPSDAAPASLVRPAFPMKSGLVYSDSLNDAPSSSFCSLPPYDAEDEECHGPVFPYPARLRGKAYYITLGLLITTQAFIVAQTIADIIFAARGQDVLG